MLMRGIMPPRLGSVRDKVMTEMFARERLLEHENLATMALMMGMALGVDADKAKRMFKVLEEHRDRQMFKHWMVDKRKEVKAQKETDLELLERLNRMGGQKWQPTAKPSKS
jgi:hypothetical protein